MEKVYVKITLTDFTPISEAKITTENKDVEKRLSKNKEKFVKNCLDNIKKDNLIINYNRANANQPLNFYKSFNNDCYTDGYVGVMKSTFQAHENFDPIQNNTQGDAVQASYEVEAIIEIRSRFDNDPKKPYFLSTMLMESLGLKLDHSLVPTNDDDFFDFLLIFLFKQQLETAYEKGFYKTYVSFEENDDKPKDTIDIDRHIRLNMGQNNGKIAYSHRESTYNNPFNHLIICAYEYLKKKFPDQTEAMINDCTAYDAIRQIRTFISYNNYQNSIMIAKNLRPITHPFFLEYEALRQTCIMILRDEGVSIFSGNENETQSIVFYLPDLWELYMEKHLKKDKMDYKINSQCKLKVLSMQEIPNDKISQIEFKCDDNGDFRLKTYF